MAFSSSKVSRSLAGNVVIEVHSWDADAVTSGSISTGLSVIQHVSLNNNVTEGDGLAVASGANVDISGVTLSDTGTVLVVGY